MVLKLRLGGNSHAEAQSTQSSFFKRVRGEKTLRLENAEKRYLGLLVDKLTSRQVNKAYGLRKTFISLFPREDVLSRSAFS